MSGLEYEGLDPAELERLATAEAYRAAAHALARGRAHRFLGPAWRGLERDVRPTARPAVPSERGAWVEVHVYVSLEEAVRYGALGQEPKP